MYFQDFFFYALKALNTLLVEYFPVWKDLTVLESVFNYSGGSWPRCSVPADPNASSCRHTPQVKLLSGKERCCSNRSVREPRLLPSASRASPRTPVTSDVAPPTYFCEPPCAWKYGGPSDSGSARPKLVLFTGKAMNESASGGVGDKDLGGHERKQALAGSVAGLRAPERPRSASTSGAEVPLVRPAQREKLRKTGRVHTEVSN